MNWQFFKNIKDRVKMFKIEEKMAADENIYSDLKYHKDFLDVENIENYEATKEEKFYKIEIILVDGRKCLIHLPLILGDERVMAYCQPLLDDMSRNKVFVRNA